MALIIQYERSPLEPPLHLTGRVSAFVETGTYKALESVAGPTNRPPPDGDVACEQPARDRTRHCECECVIADAASELFHENQTKHLYLQMI